MRNTYKPLFALMAGAMLFGACSDETVVEELIVDEPSPVKGIVTFAASMADDDEGTRASIGAENTIVWDEGDSISVISAGENNKCTLVSGAYTTQGSFIGTCETGTDIYAIYPYSENHRVTAFNPEKISDFVIDWNGATQTAVLGSFPLNTPMVAVAPDVEEGATTIPLAFQNVCALVKFTTDYACKKVVLKSKGTSDKLASEKIIVDYDANNKPRIYQTSGATSNTITLTGKDGGNLVAGTYYIAVMPGTLASGFDLTFSNIYEEKTKTKSTTKSVTLKRGTILNLGEISIKSEMIHLSGSGTEANPYLINDFDQLEEMRDFVNHSTGGADYYKLANNIDGGGKSFTPIGTQDKPFFGHFDGNGKKISNIKLGEVQGKEVADLTLNYRLQIKIRVSALFGFVQDATIKDVTIDQMTTLAYSKQEVRNGYSIFRSPFIGIVVGKEENTSIISNVTVTADQNIYMKDIPVNYSSSFDLIYGGIVAASFANMTISNCTNNCSIETESVTRYYLGGIVGSVMGGQEDNCNLDFDAKVNILNCRNFGEIKVLCSLYKRICVGGIAGFIYDDTFDNDVKVQIASCVNFGNIEVYLAPTTVTFVAGIVGSMLSDGFGSEDPVILCCINNGNIHSSLYASGICGSTYDTDTKITCCANTGTITATETHYSIVGKVDDDHSGTVSQCWNNNTSCEALSADPSKVSDSKNDGGSVEECIALMNARLADLIAEPSIYFVHKWKKYAGDETKLDLDF